MKRLMPIIFIVFSLPHLAISQDKKIDQLEILYSQKHYTKVLRKAEKLLAIPDYDYSGMPSFYKSLALFRLLENEEWKKRHQNALSLAVNTYKTFLTFSKADSYTKSHYFEIAELKQYLVALQEKLKKLDHKKALVIKQFLASDLSNISFYGLKHSKPIAPAKNTKKTSKKMEVSKNTNHEKNDPTLSGEAKIREDIVNYAKLYVGTPYAWAGTTPKGFDCSGYIGYIYKNYGITIPRSAAAQKEYASKLDKKEAMKGDLIFFKTGHKITHVGIIISNTGEPLTMIHSSSSKGIITTEIQSSSYWHQKYAGVGRIINP